MKFIIKKLCVFIVLICTNTNALELTVYVPIYEHLSKTISTPVVGTSSIIIDRKDLEKYTNTPIHKIIDKESGIKSRSIYGPSSSGSKTTIDIRGMGAQAKSNVLILVNGQRLNNIDMSEIDFPSIPIESIDRIEIFKGNAAAVLYGEGSIGGAINIITSPQINNNNKNEVIIKKGTFNHEEVAWNTFQKINNYSINIYFNHVETDGFRDENEQQQNNFTSEFRYPGSKGDHFFSVSLSEQIMSTPSDRSQDQLYSDRKGSNTPDDYINSFGSSFIYSTEYNVSDSSKIILNSSVRLKDSYSDLQSTSYPSYSDTSLTNYQFTPRINHSTKLFGKISRSTYGFDIQYADYLSYRKKNEDAVPLHVYDAWQSTLSFYTQQSISLSNYTTLGAGLRVQRNRIAIGDHLDIYAPDYAGWQTEHATLSDQETNFAYNIGLDHSLNNNKTVYARIGSGFRYANIDDRIGGSEDTSLELYTQKTNDFEFGLKIKSNDFSSNISTYFIEGKNELAYDTDAFQNININATRRFGVELKTINKISDKLSLTNNFTFSKAKYVSGNQGSYATDFKDNDVPLVPQYSLDTSLEWEVSEFTIINPTINYQDDMRMESDDENFQDTKIPSYVLFNMDITSKFDNFFTTLSINNIIDKKYHNYAVASSSTLGAYNAYPEPGREIALCFGIEF